MKNLKTREMEIKARKDRESKEKESVAFKASPKELKKEMCCHSNHLQGG